ncbi:hypothetical protein H072_9114 [Dactylellina haptotyla CBS 200.50]|uniref:Uncharacterized protein n=1 Tax=Dactylellina haptotyla (strain CBS 200.50) TaxID=1284197 RepID=S8A2I5_DACHA|nr:hypothetical protein H072_9114 [Dactylellina haptotyla CBS 200.50]
MKLSSYLFLAPLVAQIWAAAIPTPDTKDIAKREPGAQAWIHVYREYKWTFLGEGWETWIRVDTWGLWDDDAGQGFRDNIVAKCSQPPLYSWYFWYDQGPPPTWGHARIWMPGYMFNFVNIPACVADAVGAASWYWGPVTPTIIWDSSPP